MIIIALYFFAAFNYSHNYNWWNWSFQPNWWWDKNVQHEQFYQLESSTGRNGQFRIRNGRRKQKLWQINVFCWHDHLTKMFNMSKIFSNVAIEWSYWYFLSYNKDCCFMCFWKGQLCLDTTEFSNKFHYFCPYLALLHDMTEWIGTAAHLDNCAFWENWMLEFQLWGVVWEAH